MNARPWISRVVQILGIASGLAAAVAALWLVFTYVQARRVLPAEKALVESLKEKARTDSEVQKVLQPETDRQLRTAIARRRTYRFSGIALLLAGGVFLWWLKWGRAAPGRNRPARPPDAARGGDAPAARPVLHLPRSARSSGLLDLGFVDRVVEAEGCRPEAAIPILQAVQSHYRYLPEPALHRVCELTGITPAQIAGVASFYGQFRRKPVGDHILRVCEGTACHVAGADEVGTELRRCLGIGNGEDTDPSGQFTIERVACIGSCSLAPVVTIDDRIYGHVSAFSASAVVEQFLREREAAKRAPANGNGRGPGAQLPPGAVEFRIGLGSCGVAAGANDVYSALRDAAGSFGHTASVKPVGCSGLCHREPLVEVVQHGKRRLYGNVGPSDVRNLVRAHARPAGLVRKVREEIRHVRARLSDDAAWVPAAERAFDAAPYLSRQVRVVLENCGEVDPLSLAEYRSRGGMQALERCLRELTPGQVIGMMRESGLRGRGGAGFPTGVKWERTRASAGPVKYVICNGDEGDPGAFMDRAVLEADPFRILEGLIIAAYAVGAGEGFFYVRREYPIAVAHIRAAIRSAEEEGILGERIFGSDFGVNVHVREGAGAFVCGEETALIESLEGRRGTPRLRPPYPAQAGLRGCPTVINNAETLACVPWIIRNGAAQFAGLGTGKSKGTKVFSLAGKVNRGGLIEVPMGITIRDIVEQIGGGIRGDRGFKAVLIGGPSGGCIPASLADTRIDYEELASTGAIMGSGGLVVLDDRDCAVEIARYFLHFTQNESCGKCTFCRIGTKRMLEILERICAGKGQPNDLRVLEDLGTQVKHASLCGLGQTAPNPVLTTLRYFRAEYEAHITEKRCPAASCKALIHYRVMEKCTGCTLCAQACPAGAIERRPYERHEVIDDRCTRCGMCVTACPEDAIQVA